MSENIEEPTGERAVVTFTDGARAVRVHPSEPDARWFLTKADGGWWRSWAEIIAIHGPAVSVQVYVEQVQR